MTTESVEQGGGVKIYKTIILNKCKYSRTTITSRAVENLYYNIIK